jgi:hypothetical protein
MAARQSIAAMDLLISPTNSCDYSLMRFANFDDGGGNESSQEGSRAALVNLAYY